MKLADVATAFRYGDAFPQRPNVEYETLLDDCIRGDATPVSARHNIEAGWAAVQSLIEARRRGEPEPYPSGSDGPSGANALLGRDVGHGRQSPMSKGPAAVR